MKTLKKALFIAAFALGSCAYSANAQVYVTVRPDRPHYERVVAPSPRHVWVEEEWEPRGGTYVWTGGHWVEPPRARAVWVGGHWRHRPHGWVWVRGRWR